MPFSTPLMLMSMQRLQAAWAAAWSAKKASGMMPALLTITSIPPCALTLAWTRAVTSSSRVTSATSACALPPAARMASTVSRTASPLMSPQVTRAPRAAAFPATSRPKPPPAPVMTMVFPAIWSVMSRLPCGATPSLHQG